MTTTDPYVRLYHRFPDEFPDVWDSDAACALWFRLLRLADMAWPSAATLPYGVRRAALSILTSDRKGGALVQMVTATTYRVRGMDKERGKRSDAARDAAVARWDAARNAERNADGNAETMPTQPTPPHPEPNNPEEPHPEQPAQDAAVCLERRTGVFPSRGTLQWLNRLSERHGEARVVGVIAAMPQPPDASVGDYLRLVENELRRQDHAAEKREAAEERARLVEKRKPVANPVLDEYRAAIARNYGGDAA